MSTRRRRAPEDQLPDVRDGLTRLERAILHELSIELRVAAQERDEDAGREHPRHRVRSALIYGRVAEQLDVSIPEFQQALRRLLAR